MSHSAGMQQLMTKAYLPPSSPQGICSEYVYWTLKVPRPLCNGETKAQGGKMLLSRWSCFKLVSRLFFLRTVAAERGQLKTRHQSQKGKKMRRLFHPVSIM